MSYTLKHTGAIAMRALRQLLHDRRFLALSLIGPVVIIYFLKLFFDTLESPVFKPTQFIVPVGAFIVHFITYLLCSLVLVRERTAQTLSRMFINGYRQVEIISGYLLAYTFLATMQSLLVLSELSLLFNLGYNAGQLFSIYLVIWLLAIISIALGIFVSNFARSEGQVLPFIPIVIFLSVFLSGLLIPIDKLPDWAQWLSRAIPVYYANQVIQHLIKPNGAIGDDWGSFAGLPIYGVVILSLATLTLREQD